MTLVLEATVLVVSLEEDLVEDTVVRFVTMLCVDVVVLECR